MPSRLAARAALAALLLFAFGLSPLRADAPRTVHLTILHTNDTHGHLLPYSYPEIFDPDSDLAKLKTRHDIGGIARRATLAKRVRQEKGHETLLIDAGDICDGTPFSTEYRGDADIAAMNAAGYDLGCPGNHEFSNTLAQVRKMMTEAKFPLLCANVTVKADGRLLYTPYIIRVIGGAKIAFFGLLTFEAQTYPAALSDLTVEPPVETARRLVPELRKQADFVIAVTHIGVKEDRLLAASVNGIDAIVGGHSHTLLPYPLFIGSVPSGNPQSVNGTVIVQDFQWAGTLGRLDLTLHRSEDGKWSVQRYAGRLLPVTRAIPEDPAVAAVVSRFWNPIKAKYGEVIGRAADDFAEKRPDYAEYNLVADAVREETGVEFDMENTGGVRALLVKGPITYADMVTMDPFSNTVILFRATGRQLKEILTRRRPAVSGIRYVLDSGRLIEATLGGGLIEDDRTYLGATNSFFARVILSDVTDKTDTKKARLDLVMDYIRKHKTVAPAYDGRRVLRNMIDVE
jgi:5'-nucleotidase/UDP-sugar diphosphatase